MIYTTLLEPYQYPRIVPIEVTVLRGARRLRLATPLRRKYSDFVPKIWNIMAKLGYQKYLQKIYVSIDANTPLQSPFYQLPIVIAILDAVGMLRLRQNIYCIGRFLADYSLLYPEFNQSEEQYFPSLSTAQFQTGDKIEMFLNTIHTNPIALKTPRFSLQDLFPCVVFEKNSINVNRTALSILKRIPESTYSDSSLTISMRNKPLTDNKMSLIQSLPRAKNVNLVYKKCFCEKTPCTCTKKERLLHTEQLLILKEYAGQF